MLADIIYVDDDIVVINKPAGIPAHPLDKFAGPTALDFVLEKYPEVAIASENPREGGLCHRLDNDTSGILVFARHQKAYVHTRDCFRTDQAHRVYIGLAQGEIKRALTLDDAIAHHPKNKRKMVVVGNTKHKYYRGTPQPATTQIEPVAYVVSANTTLFVAKLFGGRRHQIRVHLSQAGHPLIGDTLYDGPKPHGLPSQALHAFALMLPKKPLIEAYPTAAFLEECEAHNIDKNKLDEAFNRARHLAKNT